MKSELYRKLIQVPPLQRSEVSRGAVKCKICNADALKFDIVDFNKACSHEYYLYGFSGIPVIYYRCQNCSFIFTKFFDDWTIEDFGKFIYNSDYQLVDGSYASVRPESTAVAMADFLQDHHSARILDYGSGTGAFAERLKRAGFAGVHNYDLFSSPSRPPGEFDIITCFETIEHSPFPKQTIADLLSFMAPDGCIILGTSVQPPNINELGANWWYIAPRDGHVSIYSLAALELLGRSVGLEPYSGAGRVVFARRTPAPQLMPLLRPLGRSPVSAQPPARADRQLPQLEALLATRSSDWHPTEQSGEIRFRWTHNGRIEWTLKNQPSRYPWRLALTIPFLMEITPGFAAGSLLEVASRRYPVHVAARAITATIELAEPLQGPIALITPEPQRPSDLRDSPDHRALGLAIPLTVELTQSGPAG